MNKKIFQSFYNQINFIPATEGRMDKGEEMPKWVDYGWAREEKKDRHKCT